MDWCCIVLGVVGLYCMLMCNMVCNGLVWYGIVWYGMLMCCVVQCGLDGVVWFCVVCKTREQHGYGAICYGVVVYWLV